MASVALDKCSLVSIFVESVIWGLFLCSYTITIFLLLQKKTNIHKFVPHLVLVTVVFVLCTSHVALSFVRVTKTFFGSANPNAYLAGMDAIYRVKFGLLFVNLFLGDLFIVVSRSFVLWNKNYFVAMGPALMTVGTLVAAGVTMQLMAIAPEATLASNEKIRLWMAVSLILTLATKVVCLCLVTFRVQQIRTVITANVDRHIVVYTFLVGMTESGALALLTAIILLPTYMTGLNEHIIICDALSPMTGITVTAIFAGMLINLSSPTNPTTTRTAAAAWTRQSRRTSPLSPSHKARWNDDEEDSEVAPSKPGSPAISRPGSVHNHANPSTGTLNMAIVI